MTDPVFSLSPDGKILTVRIAMRFRRRGGRKEIIVPAAELPEAPADKRGEKIPDDSPVMTLALARAWGRRVEVGETPDDIARTEKRSVSYVYRVLRLTLLAPDIVVAIATGRWVPAKPLTRLDTLPANWEQQRALLGIPGDHTPSL